MSYSVNRCNLIMCHEYDQIQPPQNGIHIKESTSDLNEDTKFCTLRTELQHKKSEIIPDINKSLKMKKGAETLLNADQDSKIFKKGHKSNIEKIMDAETATLGLLKDKMDCLNTNLSTYQDLETHLPFIPLGLKETYYINFKEAISPFIESHYHANPEDYASQLDLFSYYRTKIMEPQRTERGLEQFKHYYSFVNTVERRFFDASVRHGFRFSWSDAFTGERHQQRSPAFEKGCLIFNYAALCSQIAVSCNAQSVENLEQQAKMFGQTRANLNVLQENFAYAPSRDMKPDLLKFLVHLMQIQAQESVFMREMLTCRDAGELKRLVKYIGGASYLSEVYGKLASPTTSEFSIEDWNQVTSVIPYSWLSLLEVKSHYYQAQIYYKLAILLLTLATTGKTPGSGMVQVGPLPARGLYSDDEFLESEINRQLKEIFASLGPYVQLHRQGVRSRHKVFPRRRRHYSHSTAKSVIREGTHSRPRSRIRRTLSSLSISNLGRSKSQASGLNDSVSSVSSCVSSRSVRSGENLASSLSMPDLAGVEGEPVAPPSTRKDAHLLGQVCLVEALYWAQMALRAIEQSPDLYREAAVRAFVYNDFVAWSDNLESVKNKGSRANNSNGAPKAKPRTKWMFPLKSFGRSSKASDTKSVVSTASIGSKKSSAAGADDTPWTAPTFLPVEIELPKDLSYEVLKCARGNADESKDPFRGLGPLKYFNAQKWWSESYTVQLIRDEKVVYGFSIQGTGPVEILGVDPDTPASDKGMRTGDLVVNINGMDARFMTHNEAVAAIRFGAEGYERAIRAQAQAGDGNEDGVGGSFPPEVDYVQLTLMRPLPPPQSIERKPSVYLVTPSTPVSLPATPKMRKHSFTNHLRSLGKSSSTLFSSDDWFFGLSTKLRKHNSCLSGRDAFAKYRGDSPST